MYHETMFARPLRRDRAVQCRICEHYCTLRPGEWGKCGVRVNREGTLYLTVYAQAVAAHIDPVEKKPLFHFLPGSRALSIGTFGCNMQCQWCQNWDISQVRQKDPDREYVGDYLPPEQLIALCRREGIESIAYTYNEPTVFFEYTLETAKLAHEAGIKNIYVSNGFMTQAVIEALVPYLDGINVDLKAFREETYRRYTGARLGPVKRNIAYIARETPIWIEVTTLLIPGLNDSDEELREMAEWLASVDVEMPWHVTAFYPTYRMTDRPPTPPSTLDRAYEIGKAAGLHYVYEGNVYKPERESTYCPQCGALLIERRGYRTRTLWQEPGRCPRCGAEIAGLWK